MLRRHGISLVLLSLCVSGFAANWPDRPTLRAVRVPAPPVLDGDLSDAAWQNAPEFTDFTQHDPDDGKPATMKTSIRVVYDDKAIYFGAKVDDPERPTALLGRRDSFLNSDFLSINIDSQHDRLSGAAFTVYPSNVQIDSILYNDIGEDGSWDAVWDSATKIVSDGWIAEVRVPFSQLRFPEKQTHTWGLNITRRTVRKNEWARIVNVPKGETGFVSRFADLVGIEGIHRERSFELVPYAVARTDLRSGFDAADPFLRSSVYRGDAGLDLKYGLTSNLTLTATVNPDFGQVEVDPAVVNLGQFETFFPEKRPFFTEGVNIFRFGDTPARSHFNFVYPPQLFYSRRIGRSPQGGVDAEYVAYPTETTILGAAKITGKMGNGWSIGVLDALTANERARYVDGDLSGRQQVEPMTNYFVGRATKEYGSGSRIGFFTTAVNRRLEDELSSLRKKAYGFGVDGYTRFRKREWIFEWAGTGTRVEGSPEAIQLTQRSAARYYQRPDADHVEFDPTRTALTGFGGRAMAARQTGLWRPNVQVQAYSPGFETNDVGFMLRTDMVSAHALMQYFNDKPSGRHRSKYAWFGTWGNYSFGGETFDRGYFIDTNFELQNYWRYWGAVFLSPSNLDDRHTRGGPLVVRPRNASVSGGFSSDDRKPVSFSVNFGGDVQPNRNHGRYASVSVQYRPAPNLSFDVGPYFSRNHEYAQFVTSFPDVAAASTFGRRYVFSELEQRTFELSTRADWTVNPRLSFQLYLQPFIAAGDYHDLKQLARPRTADYVPFSGNAPEPDFNFRSVRGSAVARWEFRPGSAVYLVWNENRATVAGVGDFHFSRDLRAIPAAPSHDVILLKVSYWLPL